MNRLALLFAVLLAAGGPAAATSPNPKDLAIPPTDLSRARGLVGKLGSEDFTEREDAQDELAKMGRLALPALLAGMNKSPSPEVRSRCEALLPRAAAEDLHARLATFLADTGGKYEHDLPGWNEFRKVAGSSAAAREVFGELLADQPNRELVLAVSGPPAELGGLIADRREEFYQMRFPRGGGPRPAPRKEQTLPDLLALMFAESHIGSKFVVPVQAAPRRRAATTTVYNLTGLAAAVADGGEKARVYKAVVGRWVETRDDAMSMYQACTMAQSLNMPKEAAVVCGKLVGFKGANTGYRANAAMTIARLEAKEQLPALEAAFGDEAAIRTARIAAGRQELIDVQIRDLALAAAVMLTGQEPKEYGLVEQNKGQSAARLSYSNWQLPEDKRKAAFDKWKAWRAKHPDFGKDKGD